MIHTNGTAFPSFNPSALATFDAATVPRFDTADIDAAMIESELAALPHLAADLRFDEPPSIERIYRAETAATAAATLGSIPHQSQAIHLIINGRFALWDFVAAVLKLAGEFVTIRQLYLATLGFSRKNIAELCTLLDAGRVHRVALLCSHYFKGTSGGIYEYAQAELNARGQRFFSVRTHAKVVLVRLSDDRRITFESSANLRSCKNIEQVVVSGLPDLYAFHVEWMEQLFP